MVTGYAVFGDLGLDVDETRDTVKQELSAAIFGHDPAIESVDYYEAADRQMAIAEFTIDEADSINDILLGSQQWIGLTDERTNAEEFIKVLEKYPRDSLGPLLIRGMSPRPTKLRQHTECENCSHS